MKFLDSVTIEGDLDLSDPTGSDGAGARARSVTLSGKTLAGVAHTLLKLLVDHEGAAADQKGRLRVYINDGNDGTSPTLFLTVSSGGIVTFASTPAGLATSADLAAAIVGLLEDKGNTDCSSSPNYPAASKGDIYTVSVAGKIGGASGTTVEVGDSYRATADNAGGTQAGVGSSWVVLQANLVGALVSGGALGTPSSGSAANLTGLPLAGMAALAANSFIGNNTGSPATPIAMTVAQAKTLLAIAAGDVSGLGALATQSTLTAAQLAALAFGPFTAIASAATTDLSTVATIGVSITGTTNITGGFGTGANLLRIGKFAGILVLTHNATSMILPGAANITTAAGDRFIAISDGSGNWTVIDFVRAAVPPGTAATLQTARTIGGVSFDGSGNITQKFTLPFHWPGAAMTTAAGKTWLIGSINLATAGIALEKAVHFSRLAFAFTCGAQVGTPQVRGTLWTTNQTAGSELLQATSAVVATTSGQGNINSTTLLNGLAGALAAGTMYLLSIELVGGTSATITFVSGVLEGTYD